MHIAIHKAICWSKALTKFLIWFSNNPHLFLSLAVCLSVYIFEKPPVAHEGLTPHCVPFHPRRESRASRKISLTHSGEQSNKTIQGFVHLRKHRSPHLFLSLAVCLSVYTVCLSVYIFEKPPVAHGGLTLHWVPFHPRRESRASRKIYKFYIHLI